MIDEFSSCLGTQRHGKRKQHSRLTLSKIDCFPASSAVTTSSSANSDFMAPSVYAKVSPGATISHYLVVEPGLCSQVISPSKHIAEMIRKKSEMMMCFCC